MATLCDGLGDGVMIEANPKVADLDYLRTTSFRLLQVPMYPLFLAPSAVPPLRARIEPPFIDSSDTL
jgi:hypothetical protein